MMIAKRRLAAVAALSVLVSLTTSIAAPELKDWSSTNIALASTPVVLVDSAAKCSRLPFMMKVRPQVCETTKYGNGVTDTFKVPTHNEWGMTWAYRCRKPNDFWAVVGLPDYDGVVPATYVTKHGRKGHGFLMETTRFHSIDGVFPPRYRTTLDVVINSTCSWHVRVVVGGADVVAQEVPPIPDRG